MIGGKVWCLGFVGGSGRKAAEKLPEWSRSSKLKGSRRLSRTRKGYLLVEIGGESDRWGRCGGSPETGLEIPSEAGGDKPGQPEGEG